MGDEVRDVVEGDGYTAGTVDALGAGPGFRKVRKALGVTAFGVNAIVLPEGYNGGPHFHERQEELYFVHQGTIEFRFGEDGAETRILGPGGLLRVAPETVRAFRNVGDGDAVYLCVGGEGGYVGRDGRWIGDPATRSAGVRAGDADAGRDGMKVGDANPADAEDAAGAA